MKHLDFLAASCLFLVGGLIGNLAGRNVTRNTLYPLTTVVTEVNQAADVVNGTVGIYDDSIVKAIYGGNVDNYVDMETVEDFKANADGLMLYLTDGTGYWLEK